MFTVLIFGQIQCQKNVMFTVLSFILLYLVILILVILTSLISVHHWKEYWVIMGYNETNVWPFKFWMSWFKNVKNKKWFLGKFLAHFWLNWILRFALGLAVILLSLLHFILLVWKYSVFGNLLGRNTFSKILAFIVYKRAKLDLRLTKYIWYTCHSRIRLCMRIV